MPASPVPCVPVAMCYAAVARELVGRGVGWLGCGRAGRAWHLRGRVAAWQLGRPDASRDARVQPPGLPHTMPPGTVNAPEMSVYILLRKRMHWRSPPDDATFYVIVIMIQTNAMRSLRC